MAQAKKAKAKKGVKAKKAVKAKATKKAKAKKTAKVKKAGKAGKAKAGKIAKKAAKKAVGKQTSMAGQSSAKSKTLNKAKIKRTQHSQPKSDEPSLLQNELYQSAPSPVEQEVQSGATKDVAESGAISNIALVKDTSVLARASSTVDEQKLAAVGECVDSYMDDKHDGWENSDKVTKYKYSIESIPAVLSVIRKCLKDKKPSYKLSPSVALYESCISDETTILLLKIYTAEATELSA